jgi:uncharacterized protein (DUF433 family)
LIPLRISLVISVFGITISVPANPYQPMNPHPLISADPHVMTGVPCVRGTRVTVANVVRQIAAGRMPADICRDYPQISEQAIHAALSFAADVASAETHELAA